MQNHRSNIAVRLGVSAMLIMLFTLSAHPCRAGTDTPANQPLTVQQFESLGFDAVESQLMRDHIPQKIQSNLLRTVAPEVWGLYMTTLYFDESAVDSNPRCLAIYYSDAEDSSSLQLFTREGANWTMRDETHAVGIGGQLGLSSADVDCDGKPELITHCVCSAAGYEQMEVVSVAGDSLNTITPHTQGNWVVGRMLQLKDLDGDCTLEIEGYYDGARKYDAAIRMIWKLNPETGTYYLESKEDISEKK